MKKLLYLSSTLVLISSFAFGAGRGFAQHSQATLLAVKLCSSAPIGVPGDNHLVQGIFNGIALAVAEEKAAFKKAGMNLQAPDDMNDGKADGSAVDPDREAQNARACLDDKAAIAYIGTLNSSMAQVSEPILNNGSMLMISPSNSNAILTDPGHRSTYEPLTASGKLKNLTYYRVVTTDNLQGPAGAQYMAKNLHVKKLFVADDGQTYGVGLAERMRAYNTSAHLGMTVVGTGRVSTTSASAIASTANSIAQQIAAKKPAAVYCGCDEPNAYPLLRAARRDGWKGSFIGGDAIYDSSWFKFVGHQQANGTFATFIGKPVEQTNGFLTAYKAMFPTFTPGPYDALAYDASKIALEAALNTKGFAKLKNVTKRRAAILPYVASIHYMGANGAISFDSNGDTNNRVLSVFHANNGDWHFLQTVNNLPASLKPTG